MAGQLPEAAGATEEFVLETSPDLIPQGRLYAQLDLSLAKSQAESLFLATLMDVEQKAADGSRYSLIRAAGLLRQLLLDPTPLVHVVVAHPGRRSVPGTLPRGTTEIF